MSIKRQRGLTIIELVLFMVIMGVAAAGIIGVLNIGTKSSADPLRRKQAMLIAEAYMEEVQLAGLTFCAPGDLMYGTATKLDQCTPPAAAVGQRVAGTPRPFASVADYATVLNTAQPTFANPKGVDLDVSGRPLGQGATLTSTGNSSLAGITTTVTLNVLSGADRLGPAGVSPIGTDGYLIGSTQTDLEVLRITITTTYGTGKGDVVTLDGYRTRYAP